MDDHHNETQGRASGDEYPVSYIVYPGGHLINALCALFSQNERHNKVINAATWNTGDLKT